MTRSTLYRITVGLLLLLFCVNPAGMTVAAPDAPTQVKSMDGLRQPVVLRLDPSTSTFRIPPPASYMQHSPQRVQTAIINVTYLPNGATDAFNLSCLTWPAEAIAAFEYAVDIWETLINSTVPIEVRACWTTFANPGILGVGGADNYYQDFTGAPMPDTWYPTALANALHGSRMSGSAVDIHVAYGSAFPWYYGTDGNTPWNKVDFASVVLHEICHGLGFAGSMIVDSGLGYWDWGESPAYPTAYDHFAENGAGTALLSYPNGSTALAAQLTSNDLYFDAPNAKAANGGQRPKLFAPATWMQGSSYSHLDEIYNGTANDLMTYAIPNGQSMHSPGPIAMGILRDTGWPSGENTPPTLSGLPNQTLTPGQSKNSAINLWTYAYDAQDATAVLTFTITNSPPLTVGVMLRDNQYIDINPTESFTGTFPVVVEVMDTGGLTDTGSFTITFTEIETQYIYLPLVLRSYPLPPELPTVFEAVEDACILQGYPNSNAGTTSDMWAGYDDYLDPDAQIVRSLIKFDLSAIPSNTPISSAVLRIRYISFWDYPDRSRTITSYRIGSNWSEGTVTWNSAPTIGEAYGSVGLVSLNTAFGWYSIDVTNLVRGWVNGTLPNYGVMLRGPEYAGSDSSWRGFATKESGYPAYLQLTYTGMAATEAGTNDVFPAIGYSLSNGDRLLKTLESQSQHTLCDLFGCVAP